MQLEGAVPESRETLESRDQNTHFGKLGGKVGVIQTAARVQQG